MPKQNAFALMTWKPLSEVGIFYSDNTTQVSVAEENKNYVSFLSMSFFRIPKQLNCSVFINSSVHALKTLFHQRVLVSTNISTVVMELIQFWLIPDY